MCLHCTQVQNQPSDGSTSTYNNLFPLFSVLLFFQMLSTNKHSNEWTVLACVCKMLLKKESKTFYNIFFGWTKPL